MKTANYKVTGMTCSGCERTVSKVITNIDGVVSAKADANAASVAVEFDPAKVTVEKIKEAVDRVGYKFGGEN
jgi:copper chaperone CopZ